MGAGVVGGSAVGCMALERAKRVRKGFVGAEGGIGGYWHQCTVHRCIGVGLSGLTCGSKSGQKCFFPKIVPVSLLVLKQMVLGCFQ